MAWVQHGSLKGPKGDKGDPGDDGAPGAPGARGSTWTTGHGAPTPTGNEQAGDMYLDLDTGDVYQF